MSYKEKMKNFPIKIKLRRAFGVITLVACIIGIILIMGMEYISSNIKGIYEGPMTNISDVGNVKYALTDLQRAINRLILEGSDGIDQRYPNFEKTVEADVNIVVTAEASLEEHFTTQDGKDKLKELKDKISEGESVRPQVMSLLKSGNVSEANTLNTNTYLPIVNEIKALAGELEQLIYDYGQNYYKISVITSRGLMAVGVGLIIVLVVLSTLIINLLTQILTEPAKQIADAAEIMYKGDMSAGKLITYESEDEFGHMADAMRGTMLNLHKYIEEISETLREIALGDLTKDSNEITDFLGDFVSIKESFVYILKNFNNTLNNIQKTSEQVEYGSEELSKAAVELSKGTTDQASAVQQLTATIETVASLSNTSATEAQEAYNKVFDAAGKAEQERQKMNSLTEEMQNIIDISKKIEEITSTIEDIASQTSLLALNASIEAARAGDAGKGFAVVAEQIGKLATDSSKSAVNTRELIVKTMEEINKGNEITTSVATAFENTIEQMHEFAEVAKSTNETAKNQAEAFAQIEQGIEQIASVTQNTAASSEESSAISEQLAQRAIELDNLIKEFKLYQG